MRMALNLPFAIAVIVRVGAEFSLIPEGKLHREGWKQRRLAPAPAQSCAHAERASLFRQLKLIVRFVLPIVRGVMCYAAQHSIEWNQLTGIEQLIQAG